MVVGFSLDIFYYWFQLFTHYSKSIVTISSLFIFGRLHVSRNLPISLRLFNLLAYQRLVWGWSLYISVVLNIISPLAFLFECSPLFLSLKFCQFYLRKTNSRFLKKIFYCFLDYVIYLYLSILLAPWSVKLGCLFELFLFP